MHVVFTTQVAIALLGAAVALLVIGRGPRPQGRRAEQDSRETDQDPARLAAATAATEQRGGSGMRHARLEQAVLQVSAVAPVGEGEQQR